MSSIYFIEKSDVTLRPPSQQHRVRLETRKNEITRLQLKKNSTLSLSKGFSAREADKNFV